MLNNVPAKLRLNFEGIEFGKFSTWVLNIISVFKVAEVAELREY